MDVVLYTTILNMACSQYNERMVESILNEMRQQGILYTQDMI